MICRARVPAMLALKVTDVFGRKVDRTYTLDMYEGSFTQTLIDAKEASFVVRLRQYAHRTLQSLIVLEIKVYSYSTLSVIFCPKVIL